MSKIKDRIAGAHAAMDYMANPPATCAGCGARIHFIKAKSGAYKWVTDIKKETWRCGNDPAFPVRSHAPATEEK